VESASLLIAAGHCAVAAPIFIHHIDGSVIGIVSQAVRVVLACRNSRDCGHDAGLIHGPYLVAAAVSWAPSWRLPKVIVRAGAARAGRMQPFLGNIVLTTIVSMGRHRLSFYSGERKYRWLGTSIPLIMEFAKSTALIRSVVDLDVRGQGKLSTTSRGFDRRLLHMDTSRLEKSSAIGAG